jgi:hypothetical protein
MIMQKVIPFTLFCVLPYSWLHVFKVPGFPASDQWETLSTDVKERVVSEVAEHLIAIFALSFNHAGSLYLSSFSENDYVVGPGPIVSTPFYRAIDGVVRVRDAEATSMNELSSFRGPFSDTSDYLQSFLHAELHLLSHHRSIALSELDGEHNEVALRLLERGERTIRNALELCTIYPGNIQICSQITCSTKPFSLRHDDFRLSNIMVCPQSSALFYL